MVEVKQRLYGDIVIHYAATQRWRQKLRLHRAEPLLQMMAQHSALIRLIPHSPWYKAEQEMIISLVINNDHAVFCQEQFG